MMLKAKKIAYVIISVLLIFSVLSLFGYSSEGKIEPLKEWDGLQVYSEAQISGYKTTQEEIEGTVYKSSIGNSYIRLNFDELKFNTVLVKLKYDIDEESHAKLFYDIGETESFLISDNYLDSYIASGGKTVVFQSHDAIDSDSMAINIDGSFSIESISVYMADGSTAELQISYISLAVLTLTLAILLIFEKKLGYFAWIRTLAKKELDRIKELRNGKRLPFILHISAFISSALLILSIAVLITVQYYSIPAIFAVFILAVIATALQLADRIHSGQACTAPKLFVTVAVLVGIMMCYTSPVTTHVSWDDEVHFRHSYETAQLFEEEQTLANYKLYSRNYKVANYLSSPRSFVRIMAEEAQLPIEYEFEPSNPYTLISYTPTIAANALGNLLGTNLSGLIMLNRLANLFVYVFICYLGIKKLKSGAFLFSAVCLLPSVLYLACSIGYDSWLTAWILYGFAYIISELQQPDKKITASDIVKILLAFFVGCSAKAVYCIMMIPLLFLNKEKFSSPKHARRFRAFVIITVIVIAAILIIPGILYFDLYSDSRGGNGVNSTEQIIYIVTHPLQYAKTLLWHIGNYFSFSRFNEYNSTYGFIDGYDGSNNMFFGTLATAIIMLCIFTDRKEDDLYQAKPMQRMKRATLITCFVQIIFIVTTMYIGFNEVGSAEIFGCQFRYLFPLMCPIFFFLRPKCSVNYFKPQAYAATVFGGLAFNLLIGYLLTYLIYI